MHIHLACPNCATPTRAENINIKDLVAKCHHCNSVFSFTDDLPKPVRNRPEIMLPHGIEAFHSLSALDIEISWRQTTKNLGFLIFFALFWNGILSVFVVTALVTGEYEMLLFTSLHLLVGISLIYFIITVLLNKTFIYVSRREISVEHRPLRVPFYPNRRIQAMDLDQLFVQRYVNGKTNGRTNHAFSVTARMRTGSDVKLVKGLRQPEQAAYVEQQIEKFLHIEDRAVDDEWGN